MTAAEARVHAYLVAERPELVAGYEAALPAARLAIGGKLYQALVREGIGVGRIAAPIARRLSLGRFDLAGFPTLNGVELDGPVALWRALGIENERFEAELDDSTANAALALLVPPRGPDVFGDLAAARAADPTFSALAWFEQAVVDGHPLHPGAKLKLGMTPAEVLMYSPEWGAEPVVELVAVPRSGCRVHGGSPAELLRRWHPEAVAAALDGLPDHEVLPLHPFQVANTLPRLGDGRFVRRPGATIPTRALMSVRSLAPKAGGPHLKTAIAVQTTGAVRTVSPASAANGPRLSQLLDRIGPPGGNLVVLRELAGIHADMPADDARHFAALIRENPEDHVAAGELPMPGSALLAPFGGRPLALALIARSGLTEAAWLEEYVAVAAPGLFTLLSRWGIALEAHLQNCVAVFGPDGRPRRMLVRDFGGVRVLEDRLARHGLTAGFAPGSATLADDVDDLRQKLLYPYVQNHLGELIAAIVRATGGPEAPLWAAAARAIEAAFVPLRDDPEARADRAATFAPRLGLKAMATMRLRGDVTRYTFADVPNPLAEAL